MENVGAKNFSPLRAQKDGLSVLCFPSSVLW